ncbi:hypothetical protein E2320_001647, partial [Naja naja]
TKREELRVPLPDVPIEGERSTMPHTTLEEGELENEMPDDPMGIKVGVLIDLGCTRCLITQAVVDKLNLRVIKLSVPIKFEQQVGERAAPERTYPIEYEDLEDVFKEDGTNCLPPLRPMDCAIELIPG